MNFFKKHRGILSILFLLLVFGLSYLATVALQDHETFKTSEEVKYLNEVVDSLEIVVEDQQRLLEAIDPDLLPLDSED
jgi:hypothetical protein